ncbi:polygalacturonase (Pectinase) [Bacteroides intestinalis CAG:315]|nr:polygalacturonase (Pectinase) [Bacteroides intestinalis CAG:315]
MKSSIPAVTEETPAFRDIHITNVTCKGAGRAMFFNGLPEMPIRNVHVKDVVVTDAKQGIVISQAENISIENVKIETKGTPLQVQKAKGLKVNGKTYNNSAAKALNIDL